MIKRMCLFALLAAVDLSASAPLRVFHDHDPFGRCRGELTVTEEGIEFLSEKPEHSRKWGWTDIQSFDRLSDRRFSLLTWEDQVWKPGLDKSYDFAVAPEEAPMEEADFQRILRGLKGWVTDRVPKTLEAEYAVPVKHLHRWGGCQGTLRFGSDWIVFESRQPLHSRTWRRGRDIESFWSPHRYLLEMQVFEEDRSTFQRSRRYRFRLKEPLDQSFYWKLRRETLPPY